MPGESYKGGPVYPDIDDSIGSRPLQDKESRYAHSMCQKADNMTLAGAVYIELEKRKVAKTREFAPEGSSSGQKTLHL